MQVYESSLPLEDCSVSEKYDGICAVWDGERLMTRAGNVLHAPDWFLAGLPHRAMRGELWCGRGTFHSATSICLSHSAGERWRAVRYMVFSETKTDSDDLGDYASVVRRWPATTAAALLADRDRIIAMGGEGVVVRDEHGDEHKYKRIEDAEATVVAHAKGTGINIDRCGALRVRDEAGHEFSLGSGLSTHDRMHPPAIGAIVTFCFQGRTRNGLPRFASYLRQRQTA